MASASRLKASSTVIHRGIAYLWLAWILAAAVKKLIRVFPTPEAELNGDAYWSYLPSARMLLKDPWAFLTTDGASFQVAPLSYIWPAVWGADHVLIQLANGWLFLLCILMLWRLTTRVGGLVAGIASTALMVYWPELVLYIPQVLTEAIYLFGFLLMLMALAEYLLCEPTRRRFWLTLAATGLTITLLSRPVLQLYALASVFAVTAGIFWISRRQKPVSQAWALIFNPAVLVALLAALALPIATIAKNSIYFGYHGLSTGAGSGLSYGVSPFGMGVEPIYAGFSHDASVIPGTADPSTQGHPLRPRSDSILTQTAISIVKNTSFSDNVRFFTFKLKNWLFFGPEDLRIKHQLRKYRTLEWVAILAGLVMIGASILRRSGKEPARRWLPDPQLMPNEDGMGLRRLAMFGLMLLITIGMAAQLIPVLYNIRYNLFFFEPTLIPLAGISIGMLLRLPRKQTLEVATASATAPLSRRSRAWQWTKWLLPRLVVVILLATLPSALTKQALRHRAWSMDPLRPGPTQLLLDERQLGTPTARNATPNGPLKWTTTERPGVLNIPITLDASHKLGNFLNGMWRFKLSIQPPRFDRNCRNVRVQLTHPGTDTVWYMPEPVFYAQLDGQQHVYALHGNGSLRPATSGIMQLVFNCPEGTVIEWVGAQFLQITTPEAARELVNNGTPINPSRPDDIR